MNREHLQNMEYNRYTNSLQKYRVSLNALYIKFEIGGNMENIILMFLSRIRMNRKYFQNKEQ